jgi:hypothetical protein
MGARMGNDFVRTVVLVREFLRGSCSSEVLSFNKCFVSNFEVRRRRLAVIRGPLITFLGLGKLMSEFHVKFVEVNHISMSMSRS